jgi:hypothetical protein
VNPAEKKLHQLLINLTKGFSYQDCIKYRKDRNWTKYDVSTPVERLMMIVREVKEFKNGYFDDENLFEDENNNNDNYY